MSTNNNWVEGSPPKGDDQKTYRMSYRQDGGPVHKGLFVWNEIEKTWIEVVSGPDGIALYEEDGFEVLSWKNI